MHEKLSKNSQTFAVNLALENFKLFINDFLVIINSYGVHIHTKWRSILVKTYKIWLTTIIKSAYNSILKYFIKGIPQ